jgi:hypothetical protein
MVVCDSIEAQVLYASVEDIYRFLKNERQVIRFLNYQFQDKYPNKLLTDNYFNQVFNNKQDDDVRASVRSGSQGSEGSTEPVKTTRQDPPAGVSSNFVQRKLQQYGIHNKVNHHLLNQNETEFRYILREIVEDYPQTKPQRVENLISDCNITNLNQFISTSKKIQPIATMN